MLRIRRGSGQTQSANLYSEGWCKVPTIHIELWSGRTHDQKRELVELVTEAVVKALGVKPEVVRINICEIDKQNAAIGGVLYSEE
jgi:4-oxalocrotonate tautomerase